jgi:hypothetical protein
VSLIELLTYAVPAGFVGCMVYIAFHRAMRR